MPEYAVTFHFSPRITGRSQALQPIEPMTSVVATVGKHLESVENTGIGEKAGYRFLVGGEHSSRCVLETGAIPQQ